MSSTTGTSAVPTIGAKQCMTSGAGAAYNAGVGATYSSTGAGQAESPLRVLHDLWY